MTNKQVYQSLQGRYGTVKVFKHDTGAVTRSLLTYGEWAENELSFLRSFIPAGSSVLDIGAYIGTHTVVFAQMVGPAGQVFAIEAQPDSFQLLESNTKAASDPGGRGTVRLIHAAATSQVGDIPIPVIDPRYESSYGSASLADTINQPTDTNSKVVALPSGFASVATVTIDSLHLPNCALIKVDVEGAEDAVLRGSYETVERCSPFIYCECNSLARGLESMHILQAMGYRVFAHVVNAFNPDNFNGISEDIFAGAREVGLVGVISSRSEEILSLPVRPVELLLPIHDADDLALALLNKPQYESEILRVSDAARRGGDRILNQNQVLTSERRQMHDELARLQQIRLDERNSFEEQMARVVLSREAVATQKQVEILDLHSRLTRRDADVADLQCALEARVHEVMEVSGHLEQRDAAILALQRDLEARDHEITELHNLLPQRDSAIVNLQEILKERTKELAEIHTHLKQRDAAISKMQTELFSTVERAAICDS